MAKTPIKLSDGLVNAGKRPALGPTTVGRVYPMMLSVRVDPALLDEVKDLAHARRLKIQDAVDEMMRSWVRTNGSRR